MNPLILDTDGGVDDAQALLMLLRGGRVPVAITTVFGNVGLTQATGNILATLAVAGVELSVHPGAARPLIGAAIDATQVHGADGLGGAPRPPRIAAPSTPDAVTLIREAARAAAAAGGRVDLLMIGPLTNLALALTMEAGITAGIGRVTVMGGTLNGRGNTTPAAEFNIFADPEAAAIVFRAALDLVLVPWEPCTTHLMQGADLDARLRGIGDGPLKTFGAALADHARRSTAGRGGGDVMRYVDTLAAAVAIDEGIVTGWQEGSLDVALAPGITRGMVVVDPSGRLGTPRARLVETARGEALDALYLRSLGAAG